MCDRHRDERDFARRTHVRNTGVTGAGHDPGMTDVLMPGPVRREGRDLALQSRRTLALADLLERRPDLRGVGTWAEEVARSVLWSA